MVQAIGAILDGKDSVFMALGIKEGGVGAVALDEAKIGDSKCLIADHPDVAAKMRERPRISSTAVSSSKIRCLPSRRRLGNDGAPSPGEPFACRETADGRRAYRHQS